MPRSKMLPTPASSTEIKGQDHSSALSSLQLTFELPPSAIENHPNSSSAVAASKMSPVSPTSTTRPPYLQPSETVKARRRSSAAAQQQKEALFALPPPPTKSRRIIQMKPRPQADGLVASSSSSPPNKNAASNSNSAKNTAGTGAAGSKTTGAKKQPSATSAAGRKIARKTAHSLIERRRRSKMNEEFAVLKGLIPACTGEMHKLAILQASIEYIHYLEDCVSTLKAQHGPTSSTPTEFRLAQRHDSCDEDDDEVEERQNHWDATQHADVEMTDRETTPTPRATISPALVAQHDNNNNSVRSRQHSFASDYQLEDPSRITTTSTAAGGYQHNRTQTYAPSSSSSLTSPTLRPQLEIDHEVSAALLMLGGGRATNGMGGSARGMSVQDLLSS